MDIEVFPDNLALSNYFLDPYLQGEIHRERMCERRERRFAGLAQFTVGDVINISYTNKFITYGFEGVCICLRKKRLLNTNASIILRNILKNVGIELILSYYHVRAYRLVLSNFKRKSFYYRRAKLYYIRSGLNRASRVKE
jgi:ribosomal protein L19